MTFTQNFLRPERIAAAEWEARVQLAAAYRMFDHLGWAELVYNHLSLRVPGEEGHFLINPFGLLYREVTASNLVKVDIDGRIVGPSDWPINPAGFTFHSAIHAAQSDAHCVMHLHTTATSAVCGLEDGLSFDNIYAAQLYGSVTYHEFEGITVRHDEGARIVASAGGKPVLLLRNHGPVVIGRAVPHAFMLMWLVQRACEVQVATLSMGRPRKISQTALQSCVRDGMSLSPTYGAGADSFSALQRLMDIKDPSYRR